MLVENPVIAHLHCSFKKFAVEILGFCNYICATGGFVYCSAIIELINARNSLLPVFPDVYWLTQFCYQQK